MPPKHPYTCPRCDFNTSKKSNMHTHLYGLKKVCPGIKSMVELTDDIKQHILDNRVYYPVKMNKPCRDSISASVKQKCWNTHVGEDVGSVMCFCCKSIKILQGNFVCGHVVAESNGGTVAVENLRPICAKCNCSMGSMNMDDFIAKNLL